ncbi:FtsX-like permease family protein, partial [Streptomyces sp. S6]
LTPHSAACTTSSRCASAGTTLTCTPSPNLPQAADPRTAFPGGTATALVAAEITPPPTAFDNSPKAVRAWGADGPALVGVLDLDVRKGDLAAVREGTFAAGAATAEAHKWRLGERVGLTLTDGSRTTLTLVAVYERDLAFPEFVVSRSTAVAHTDAPYADRILLTGAYRSWPGRTAVSRERYLHDLQPRGAADEFASRVIVAVVSGYALLAAANTASLAQRDRRTQHAHLRAVGLGRGQLARCLLYESLGTAAVGVALAAVTGLACLVPLAVVLGVGVLPVVDVPWTAGVLLGAVLAIAVPAVVTARPTRRIGRGRL